MLSYAMTYSFLEKGLVDNKSSSHFLLLVISRVVVMIALWLSHEYF